MVNKREVLFEKMGSVNKLLLYRIRHSDAVDMYCWGDEVVFLNSFIVLYARGIIMAALPIVGSSIICADDKFREELKNEAQKQ